MAVAIAVGRHGLGVLDRAWCMSLRISKIVSKHVHIHISIHI